MSWQASALAILGLVLLFGFVRFERSRASARIVAAVAALAALGVAGRLVLAPIPNVVATTDVALLAGYALGGGPGFAVGALSGLVSNFWLGQGPWTPWQMAGWGLAGLGGAALARLGGRELSRWSLAAAGALAGIAYGALLDLSVMVNFGGEQSVDRYLALSARGIPFNVAHALGNAALMLAAGPALVRMLDRYRKRFEVQWRDAPLARTVAGAIVCACLLLPLLAPAESSAAAGRSEAAEWLREAQNGDGGYGTAAGEESSPGMTGWAMLGLEAAGINPYDVVSVKRSPVGYLRANVEAITSTADLERTILALAGAGVDPRAFAGRDLVAELRDRQAGDGSFEHQVNLTAFAILAQHASGIPGSNFGKAAAWLRDKQNRNGGWGSTASAASEPDSTGAVLQALAVSPGGFDEVQDGARWLEHVQRHDGGWSLTPGAPSNSQSTAWAIQGLAAAGRSPGAVREDGTSGIEFIGRRQAGDGHYTYARGSDQTPVWVTAQGLTGVSREPFPIAAVKREPPEPPAKDAGAGDYGGFGGGGYGGGGDYGGYGGGGYGGGYGGYGGGYGGNARGFGGGAKGGDAKGGGKDRPGVRALAGGPGRDEDVSKLLDEGAAPVAKAPVPDVDSAPATPVLLGGLGGLGAALGAGFLWYRRRLP